MSDPGDELAKLTGRYRRATADLEAARAALIAGLRTAKASGMKQADMVRAIDHEWTREYVRKVVADD